MNSISNPFVECTARDMSYEEVSNFWCSPFDCFDIDEKMLHESITPIVIEGARGSGKTMILKYLSYFCQKEYANKNGMHILEVLKKNKSISFYFRYSDNFGKLFESLNCSSESKRQLFKQYYELYMCCEILEVIIDLYNDNLILENEMLLICDGFSKNINVDCKTFNEIRDALTNHINVTDNWIRRFRYILQSNDELKAIIKYDNLIYQLISIIRNNINFVSDLNFVLIVDEYENAADYQIVFNTLIKQVNDKNRITYRIGTRPDGMNMNVTEIGNEFLQENRDFILRKLKYKDISKYKKFIENIANLRLKANDQLNELGLTDIKKLLGEREDLLAEAKECVKGGNVKHFDVLKKNKSFMNQRVFNETVEMIRNESNPIAEMLNILWVLRGVSPEITSKAMNDYFNKNYRPELRRSNERDFWAYKYKLDYVDKYKYQLLFVFSSINRTTKKYYSFNTFCYLSSGAVNDFISLCRNTFYAIPNNFFDDASKIILPISSSIQAKAAEITAIEQIDKVKLCYDNGTKMYNFLMSMGEVFRSMHKDVYIKYPETNQFAFDDMSYIEQNDIYKSLIRWGVIVKKNRMQGISIKKKIGNLFYLNRIYAPAFNISYRTRGGYNYIISNNLFDFMASKPNDAKEVLNYREQKPIPDAKTSAKEDGDVGYQLTIFDCIGENNEKQDC